MRFLNASVLPRKSLNRNLSWGFPFGDLLPKTRVLERCVLERKRELNANACVLGTLRFRTLSGQSGTYRQNSQDIPGTNFVGFRRERMKQSREGTHFRLPPLCAKDPHPTRWCLSGPKKINFGIPAAIYKSAQGPWAPGKCPPECLLSVFGHLAPSAPKSVFLSVFWRFWGLNNAIKHSKAIFGVFGARCPKTLGKHSGGHFPARAPEHSCKWRLGSQS